MAPTQVDKSISRKPGYYWVHPRTASYWCVAQWTGDRWFVTGNECECGDCAMMEIDERQLWRIPDRVTVVAAEAPIDKKPEAVRQAGEYDVAPVSAERMRQIAGKTTTQADCSFGIVR